MQRYAFIAVLGVAISATPVTGQSGNDGPLPDCPPRLKRVLNAPVGEPIDCMCTPDIRTAQGTEKLYGSGPYDIVSNVCLAAVHAGATPPEGGAVRVIPRPPQSSFAGTSANGVASSEWGASLFNAFDVEALD